MKKKNYCCILMLLLIGAGICTSCNKKDAQKPDEIKADSKGYMAAKKDMMLTYTITKGNEAGHSYIWHVTDAKDSAGYRVASSELLFEHNIVVYSNAMFNDEKTIISGSNMPAIYYQLLDTMSQQFNISFVHEEHPVTTVIPHHDQLNTVVSGQATVAEWHGKGEDDGLITEQDYEVKRLPAIIDSLDHIQIGIGEFDCLRIRYITKVAHKITLSDGVSSPQTFENNFEMSETLWVAPGLGIIKSEEVAPAGISTTELTKIEGR